ncbi:ribonuclease HII [bacterium]|nr:ribonuclease HII [bacterium]
MTAKVKSRPDFSLEQEADAAAGSAVSVCGVDEVGRGPIAGPVLAAAVILPRDLPAAIRDAIDDSKKLSGAKREALAPLIRRHAVAWAVAESSVAEIDDINILQAALLAMTRAVTALDVAPGLALVDGNRAPKGLPCPARTVVKGDGRSLSIAAASILAKVARDRLMIELDGRFPGYGWAKNAGYPTPAHLKALISLGVTPWHRRGFAPVACALGHTPNREF